MESSSVIFEYIFKNSKDKSNILEKSENVFFKKKKRKKESIFA